MALHPVFQEICDRFVKPADLLTENETCSHVTHADWPTRQNDAICPQRALAVCSVCDAPLCVVHTEPCEKCGLEFCEGCASLHTEALCCAARLAQELRPLAPKAEVL